MNEVAQKVWSGSVQLKIVYDGGEYLLHAKRNSYFPLYFSQLVDYFSHASNNPNLRSRSAWLEYENVPLKWNLPIGLAYDLLYLPARELQKGTPPTASTRAARWKLHLHFASPDSPYPKDLIMPFVPDESNEPSYQKTLRQVYLNSLKQSTYVINGNSRAVMTLSHEDTNSLWDALVQYDYTIYSAIMKKVVTSSQVLQRRRVPVRIFVAGSSDVIQAPMYSVDETSRLTELREVVETCIPDTSKYYALTKLYIQGVDVDVLLHQPLVDVWSAFRHFDNFLNIVVAGS